MIDSDSPFQLCETLQGDNLTHYTITNGVGESSYLSLYVNDEKWDLISFVVMS